MVEMWYYTTEGKQQNPVALAELKGMFGAGVLKPTDMVWKEGMDHWIRASSLKELTGKLESPVSRSPSGPAAALDEPRSQKAIPADDRDGAPRRRLPMHGGGSSASVIFFLILGALLLLGALAVGVFILIWVAQSPGEGKINPANLVKGEAKYTVALKPNTTDSRKFSFRKGVDYEIAVKTEPNHQGVDVDISIFNARGELMAQDIGPEPDCLVRWNPTTDGEYRIDVTNVINPGGAVVDVKSKVTIREGNQPPPKEQVKEQPLPPDVKEGKGLDTSINVPIGKEFTQKFRVRAGHKASFTFVPTGAGPKTDFNIIVVKDSDPNQVIAQDNGPEPRASVSFTLPATEIVAVRILNATPKGAGGGTPRGALAFDVSP